MRALRDKRIQISPDYVQETTFNKQGGYARTLLLLRMLPRPTAIFAANDMIALGALQAIRELGLRCPNDISVIGFDDLDLCENTEPSLSSVSQPGYQMGTTAARILFERVGGDNAPPKHIVLPTSLKIRESVAPPADQDISLRMRRNSSKKGETEA
jgi:LacI family transcriptional regulator